jgi:hypothetical protein
VRVTKRKSPSELRREGLSIRSMEPSDGYEFDTLVDDLVAVIDQLDLHRELHDFVR